MIFKNSNSNLNFKNAVCFITFPNLEKFNFIRHGFSTRLGGVSKNEFTSMNFSFLKDSRKNVLENYKRFANALGFDKKNIVASHQTHEDKIKIVEKKDKGLGIYKKNDTENSDGLITNEKNVILVTFHADCTPIFFLDPNKKVVGLAHSGWRSTKKEIARKIIEKMKNKYSCNVKEIICSIGPTIGGCCYEVDDSLYSEFNVKYKEYFKPKRKNKYMLSLSDLNKKILENAGIKPSNIFTSDLCTKCYNDLFFSHRVLGEKRGTMISIIGITDT